MNCQQCGAPLHTEEGRSYLYCEYCGGYEFPSPNEDGVAFLDEVSSLLCPVCGEPLVLAVVNRVRISSCPRCRGNLVEQSKMLPILRQAKPAGPIHEDQGESRDPSELTRSVVCPSCRQLMAVYPYGGPGNITIQGCARCRLIWLDFGELSRITRSFSQLYGHSPDDPEVRRKGVAF